MFAVRSPALCQTRHLLQRGLLKQHLRSFSVAAAMGLQGKTYLVTGSTDGIGLHTATILAAAGGNVIIHGRNAQRVEKAKQQVQEAGRSGEVSSYIADLGDLQQIREFAQQVQKDHPEIDVLINNAGVFMESMQKSHDGFEMTWAVNVLAPFLLTSLLLGNVKERIINISSISAGSRIDWGNLQQEKGFSSHNSYSLSKLAMQLYTFRLAELLKASGSKVTVNTCDPGTVNTKMLYAGWGACGIDLKDANTEFQLATENDLGTGKYFVGGRQSSGSSTANNKANQEKLWDILHEQTGANYNFLQPQ